MSFSIVELKLATVSKNIFQTNDRDNNGSRGDPHPSYNTLTLLQELIKSLREAGEVQEK